MTETEIVHVDLADRSYDIVIGDGVLARAGALISDIVGGDGVIIVTDEMRLIRLSRLLRRDARRSQWLSLQERPHQCVAAPELHGRAGVA